MCANLMLSSSSPKLLQPSNYKPFALLLLILIVRVLLVVSQLPFVVVGVASFGLKCVNRKTLLKIVYKINLSLHS